MVSSRLLVSVVIPVYQERSWKLTRALQSCWNQIDVQDMDLEVLLVVDDRQDYREFAVDPRVRLLSSGGVATGASHARNVALAAARGDVIALLDADDYFLPTKIAALAPKALAYGIAVDNLQILREGAPAQAVETISQAASGVKDLAFFLAINNPFSGLYRRDVLGNLRFPEHIRLSTDSGFNYEALARNRGQAYFDATPHHVYVIYKGSLSHQSNGVQSFEESYRQWIAHFEQARWLREDLRTAIVERYAAKRALNLRFGQWLQARGAGAWTFQDFVQDVGALEG